MHDQNGRGVKRGTDSLTRDRQWQVRTLSMTSKKEALAKSGITFELLKIQRWETTRLKALELL